MGWSRPIFRQLVFNASTRKNKIKKNSHQIAFPKKSLESLFPVEERESMKGKRFLSIPVFAVFLLLGFVYYVTVFVFLENWVGLQSSAGSLNALIFTFFASLCLLSFLACVLTDPGGVPSAYVPDVEGSEDSDQAPMKNVSFWMVFGLIIWSCDFVDSNLIWIVDFA